MGDVPETIFLEIRDLDIKCNECGKGHWIKGDSRNRKVCSLGLEPETCDHDMEKFEKD